MFQALRHKRTASELGSPMTKHMEDVHKIRFAESKTDNGVKHDDHSRDPADNRTAVNHENSSRGKLTVP